MGQLERGITNSCKLVKGIAAVQVAGYKGEDDFIITFEKEKQPAFGNGMTLGKNSFSCYMNLLIKHKAESNITPRFLPWGLTCVDWLP